MVGFSSRGLLAWVVLGGLLALLLRVQDTTKDEDIERLHANLTVSDPNAAVAHLSKALSFPTVSSPTAPHHASNLEALQQMLAFLEEAYPLVYSRLKLERVNEFSHLLTWEGSDPLLKPLLLVAHLDVVPAPEMPPPNSWTHPPFSGAVADGFIWGRGALDMKGILISIYEAVEELLRQGFAPRRTIMLAFGHDEEVGGTLGAKAIAQLLLSRGVELELVLDEGGQIITEGFRVGGRALVDKPLVLIGTAEKGIEQWEIRVKGKGGHSSMPPIGGASVSARLARILTSLEARPMPARLISPTSDMLRAMGGGAKQALARILLKNVGNWFLRPLAAQGLAAASDDTAAFVRTTCAVVSVQAGGVADNVLPPNGTIKLNFRTMNGDNSTTIRQYLEEITQKERDYVELVARRPDESPASPVTPAEGPHYQLIKQAILETVTPPEGLVVAPYMLTGMTDSRYYGSVFPLASGRVFRFSPQWYNRTGGDLSRVHGVDERVAVQNYLQGIGFYMRFLQLASQDISDEERVPAGKWDGEGASRAEAEGGGAAAAA